MRHWPFIRCYSTAQQYQSGLATLGLAVSYDGYWYVWFVELTAENFGVSHGHHASLCGLPLRRPPASCVSLVLSLLTIARLS